MRLLSPPINVIKYRLSNTIAVLHIEKLLNPVHKMVLESAFDQLMQNIEGEQYVNVCAGEIVCERLCSSTGKKK
jgi:hypothetical protein